MEGRDVALLSRWFVGLDLEEAVWNHSSSLEKRLLLAAKFLLVVLGPRVGKVSSSEHFSVSSAAPDDRSRSRKAPTWPVTRRMSWASCGPYGRRDRWLRNSGNRGSTIERATTLHGGYEGGRIEEAFGWTRRSPVSRKSGGVDRVGFTSTFAAAAYNFRAP